MPSEFSSRGKCSVLSPIFCCCVKLHRIGCSLVFGARMNDIYLTRKEKKCTPWLFFVSNFFAPCMTNKQFNEMRFSYFWYCSNFKGGLSKSLLFQIKRFFPSSFDVRVCVFLPNVCVANSNRILGFQKRRRIKRRRRKKDNVSTTTESRILRQSRKSSTSGTIPYVSWIDTQPFFSRLCTGHAITCSNSHQEILLHVFINLFVTLTR